MVQIPDKDRLSQHEGHRQRLKKRFLMEGFDNFEPHNIIEMVLFYTSARQDTNGLAHLLIDNFGSVAGVCNASVEQLCSVPGVGMETAVFLKMIPEFARAYMQSSAEEKITIIDARAAEEYLRPKFIGRTKEVAVIIFLNGRGELIQSRVLSKGNDRAVLIDVSEIVLAAVSLHSDAVVLAHNHPKGFAVPSQEDIFNTDKLAAALKSVNIHLCEHFIFNQWESCRMSQVKSSKRNYYVFFERM